MAGVSISRNKCIKRVKYIGGNTSDDHLGPASGLDCLAEVFVVPGIDFAIARNIGGLGVEGQDFPGDGSIGACHIIQSQFMLMILRGC